MRIFGVLRMAPWWRGPVLLLRRPGVVLALAAAAVVAALPAAAAGPFLSSGRVATLHHQIASACPWSVGARITSYLYFSDPLAFRTGVGRGVFDGPATVARRAEIADAAAGRVPGLGAAVTTLVSEAFADDDHVPLWMVSRTDAMAHVQVLDGPQGRGVWLTDEYATFRRLRVGDIIYLHPEDTAASGAPVRVAAIYRSLRQSPDEPFWCTMVSYYRPPDSNRPSPQVALLDQAMYLDAAAAQGMVGTQFIEYPLAASNLSYDDARATVDGIGRMRTAILGPAQAFGADVWSDTKVTSRLVQFVARADLARAGVLPAVVPITGAGLLVGLVVVAAATVFWVQRRRQELLVLAAHGVGTLALGIKALIEALPALTAGTVAGWAFSWTLVRWVGPDPVLSGEAAPLATLGAATAFAAGLIVVGVVAALACRPLTDQIPRRRRGVLRRIPWELLVLAAAPVVWRWLGGQRELVDGAGAVGSVMHVPGRLLVVPIMVITGLAVLAGRLGAGYLRLRGLRRRPRAPAVFLSWRRIARRPAAAALLACATAMPISLATYGATVTGSVRATTVAEARLRIGSDVVLTLREPAPIPASLEGRATEVLRLDGAVIGGIQADLLVVDPATFARNAYWGPQLDSAAVHRLLAPLTTDRGGPVTLIGAAPLRPGDQPATLAGAQIMGGPVRIVPTATLPAQRGGYPVALVPENAFSRDASRAERQLWVRGERQLWVRGDPAQIRAAASAAHLPVTRVESAMDRYVNTVWEPLTYTFDYLMALCLLTAVVTLVVLLLYLESQAPVRRRAYVLLRRMGLSARQHRRAMLAELAIPLTGGLLAGLAVTAGLTTALGPEFEMNPDTPPNTIVAVPYLPIGLTIAAVIMVATGATLYAHRRLAGANPSEVLRDAG